MNKYLIVDNRLREFEKSYFLDNKYHLIQIPRSDKVYFEISSHVDIFCTKLNDTLILEPSVYNLLKEQINKEDLCKKNIISGNELVSYKYPNDIKYNVCQIGRYVIHNFKYTDKSVLEKIYNMGLEKIDIKQGYSKCSIAVIDEKSVIVTDKKIANALQKKQIDVLLLENENIIKNIKLFSLKNDNMYSNMNGFIGGAISRFKDKIVIFGDLEKIDINYKIYDYITSKKLEIVQFKGHDIVDYGGIIEI